MRGVLHNSPKVGYTLSVDYPVLLPIKIVKGGERELNTLDGRAKDRVEGGVE